MRLRNPVFQPHRSTPTLKAAMHCRAQRSLPRSSAELLTGEAASSGNTHADVTRIAHLIYRAPL